jgi:hypothetical protein
VGDKKRDFPDWVRDYLLACARQMISPKSARAKDLRAVLPSILGFPPAKRGPGHLLQPYGDSKEGDYMVLATAFAVEIGKGEKPSDALANALNGLPPTIFSRLDNKDNGLLMKHITECFGMQKRPRSNAGWRRVIHVWIDLTFGPFLKKYSRK